MWGIEPDRSGDITLSRQIYQALRTRIINGQLQEEETLPSTRSLAAELRVSRNTVCAAYEMLIDEGFIISRQGAPAKVASGLHIGGAAGSLVIQKKPAVETIADLRTGQPDLRLFPRFLWQQISSRKTEELPLSGYGYLGPEGLPELREEIAAWLLRSRGLETRADNIFITAGATHALHQLTGLLCPAGEKMIVEDPCHSGMLRALLQKGAPIIPVPADEKGIRTDCLPDETDVGAVYVTPSHQFPLGGILPASRRASLIRFARETGAFLIEDDYDSEFRYGGDPVAPLCSMDPQRVIYVGTFSKLLFPGLRIGYVVLPLPLQRQWCYLRIHTDVQNPPFEQAALAEFLHTRKLDRHIRKMRRIYGERRKVLLSTLTETFGSDLKVYGDSAGLHAAVEFPGMVFDETFRRNAKSCGILVTPVEYHCLKKGPHLSKLLIGYGHLNSDEIREGISRLDSFFKENRFI